MKAGFFVVPALLTAALSAGCLGGALGGGRRATDGGGWSNGGGAGGGDADGATGESACDPLAAKPTTLGAIIGVGQDATGTLYVDAANGIFVSANGELVRQVVTGTGEWGANAFTFTFQPAGGDSSSARDLMVDTQGSAASGMALGPAGARSFLGQSDAGVTTLMLVASSEVAGLTVLDTPKVVSYVGDVANGNVLVATTPVPDDPRAIAGGLSIFYGPPSAVAERPVTAYGESLSGDGSVSFLVDSVTYILTFGVVLGPDAGPLGTFALEGLTTGGDADVTVTLRSSSTTTLPSGLSFTCLP